MSRLVSAFIVLWLAAFMCAAAYAGPSVRTGEHEDYSRLVFEWDGAVEAQSKQSGATLDLNFGKAGEADGVAGLAAFNVLKSEVVSTDPLSLRLTLPEGSNARVFSIRNRVIVDITDSPARPRPAATPAPQNKEEERKPEPKPEPEPEEQPKETPPQQDAKAKPEAEQESKPENKAASAPANPAPQEQPKPVPPPGAEALKPAEPEKAAPAPEQGGASREAKKPEKPEEVARPNLISISAADNFGMAVFENRGRIFMMIDSTQSINKPVVSGHNAAYFEPIGRLELAGGQGFSAPTLPGAMPRVEGGKLIWNVIVSPDTQAREAAKPAYQNVREGEARGGSLFWALENPQKVFDYTDPESGERILFVTVEDSTGYIGGPRAFVDFDLLPSYAGLAIRPKVDDLQVLTTPEGIEILRPGGLALTAEGLMGLARSGKDASQDEAGLSRDRLFDFKSWEMGGQQMLEQNRDIIVANTMGGSESDLIQNLIVLARLHMANGQAAEALGYLRYALAELPGLDQNPQFLALRGAALAFGWKSEESLRDLASPLLADNEEARMWRSFALAGLGDWQQAASLLPDDVSVLESYTGKIRNRLGLVLAEVRLRAGEIEKAAEIFDMLGQGGDELNTHYDAQLQYLKGESARQRGEIDKTVEFWKPLTEGRDDLYRVKAGLALARFLIAEGRLTSADAIDSLERLRYAWRGDELEAQVNYWLGRTYFEAGQHIKGLKILRAAIPLATGTPLAQHIAQDMSELYTGYFNGPELDKASPLDAVALYEEFTELLPAGPEGNMAIKRLAEHMVRADMLDRAAALLGYQIDHRLQGDEAARTAVRLAAIHLLNKDPAGAMAALSKAESLMRGLPPQAVTTVRAQEMTLLRARALSQDKRPDQALALLENMPGSSDVNRLRADIAWQAGYWEDASYALRDIIDDQDISLTRPLTEEQAELILSRAVALNLSGDRIGLANIRERYSEPMAQTKSAAKFDVVTRPRQSIGLADRNTLLSAVSEVDLFKDFLDSYRTAGEAVN